MVIQSEFIYEIRSVKLVQIKSIEMLTPKILQGSFALNRCI